MHALLLASLVAAAAARPSFIAVPADQITFVDLSSLHVRVPRQTLTPPPLPNLYGQDYQPIPLQQYQQDPVPPHLGVLNAAPQPEAPARLLRLPHAQVPQVQEAAPVASAPQLAERPPDFGEFVDFGAHTGDNGAFGWYADYPINNHEDHSGYRK